MIEDPYAYQKLIGFKITDWSEGYCRLELPLREDHGNRYGLPHGGVHATLLDTAMGFAGSWSDSDDKIMAMTLSLTLQYLSRPRGGVLVAEGHRTGGGRSTFFAEGSVVDDTGELIANGTGTFRYRRGALEG
ncbi:MAG: PaaI family thioesterase [Pseudomonadota bacterium]